MQKSSLLIFTLMLCITNVFSQKSIFMRVYDSTGRLITKGHYVAVTDSSIKILNGNTRMEEEINYQQISFIKTLHTKGHSMVMGGLVGAAALGIAGAASGEKKRNDGTLDGALYDFFTYTPAEGFVMGFFTGAVIGAPVGLLFTKPKKRKLYTVNGNYQLWTSVSTEMKAIYIPKQP